MKILFLVHIEETFRQYFESRMLPKIVKAASEFDRVIHFTSNICDFEPVQELKGVIDTQIDWGWGYEPDSFGPEELPFVIPALGHEYTWIPPFLRESTYLKKSEIILGGGCDGECLQDMEDILRHLNIPYKRQPEFIYSLQGN